MGHLEDAVLVRVLFEELSEFPVILDGSSNATVALLPHEIILKRDVSHNRSEKRLISREGTIALAACGDGHQIWRVRLSKKAQWRGVIA